MLLFLFQLGDNALEEQFAVLRTATHQRNFDVLQFGDNIAIAGQMTLVYDKHEDWKRKHSKLAVRDDRDRPYFVKGEHLGRDICLQCVCHQTIIVLIDCLRHPRVVLELSK